MITTVADLILKFVNSVFTSKDSILKQKRDRRDRIANYFEQISDTLSLAAKEFENSNRPWEHYHQISYLFRGFNEVIKDVFENEKIEILYRELQTALYHDKLLLGGTRERTIVDAITVSSYIYDYRANDDKNPVKNLTQKELEFVISEEIRKIKEVAGLFKGISVELKAT